MSPTTEALFDRVRIAPDARCLDVGCGGGDVSVALARHVPRGDVLGVDLDETALEVARAEAEALGLAHVEFCLTDVTQAPPEEHLDRYDVIYVRFLLTHLPDPAATLLHLFAQLAPGGVLVVEDIDFTGHSCHPDSPAFWRYVTWYTESAQARGVDPNIGPRLPSLLRSCGLEVLGMNVVQPAGFAGEAKLVSPLTLEAITDAVLASAVCTADELEQAVDELYAFARQPDTVLSMPRVVQAWGQRQDSVRSRTTGTGSHAFP
jgi:SAM-dependent methyltransferase